MRRWLCPPSRVRCSALPSVANGTPRSIRCWIARGAASTTCSTTPHVVEPGAGGHRVVDMRLEAVARLEHRGDAALRAAQSRLSPSAPLAITATVCVSARLSAAVSPAAPEPTIRTSASLPSASGGGRLFACCRPPLPLRRVGRGQAQEHVLQIRVTGRHVDDRQAVGGQRGQHLAGVGLVLAIGDLERPLVDQADVLEAGVGRDLARYRDRK